MEGGRWKVGRAGAGMILGGGYDTCSLGQAAGPEEAGSAGMELGQEVEYFYTLGACFWSSWLWSRCCASRC